MGGVGAGRLEVIDAVLQDVFRTRVDELRDQLLEYGLDLFVEVVTDLPLLHTTIHHHHCPSLSAPPTNESTMFRAATGWSIGTRCPALNRIRSSNFPAFFQKPAIFPSIFQGVSKECLNRNSVT